MINVIIIYSLLDPIEYMAYAKTEELKFKWTESINKAK